MEVDRPEKWHDGAEDTTPASDEDFCTCQTTDSTADSEENGSLREIAEGAADGAPATLDLPVLEAIRFRAKRIIAGEHS